MDSVVKPLLVATGDNDWKESNPDLYPEIRAQTYENLPDFDGQHRFLYSLLPIGTGGHGTYNLGDASSTDPQLLRLSLALSSSVRAFLDMHLLGSSDALEYINSENPLILSGRDITLWESK